MNDWSENIIVARRELQMAEELLQKAPHGDPRRAELAKIGAADHVEQAMVRLARILGQVAL